MTGKEAKKQVNNKRESNKGKRHHQKYATLRYNYFSNMKKWIFAIFILLTSVFLSIYLLIPADIEISKISNAKTTINGEIRSISDENIWECWWRNPDGQPHIKGTSFIYDGATFILTGHQGFSVGISIEDEEIKLSSMITLVSFSTDSTGAIWQCSIKSGNNPVNRIRNYRKAVDIRKKMTKILENFKSYCSDPKNIYGINIQTVSTTDTLLLGMTFNTNHPPSVSEIYQRLYELEENIKKQKATVSGFPMVHQEKLPDSNYVTRLAYPTSKWLNNNGIFYYRRMVQGNFLTAEVRGGSNNIDRAFKKLDLYTDDYRKIRMAIPFELWVTNRKQQPDTLQWITRLYIPIQ